MKQLKFTKSAIAFSGMTALLLLLFNNCQKFETVKAVDNASVSQSVIDEEQKLLEVLNESVTRSGVLLNLEEEIGQREASLTEQEKATFSGLRDQLKATAQELTEIKDKIIDLLQVQRLSYSHALVLKEVDFLILALSEARSIQLEVELRTEIGRVERESIERDAKLSEEINNLEVELAEFKADVAVFKSQVNAKFNSLDEQIAQAQNRLNILDQLLEQYNASSIAADEALASALNDLKVFTEHQIVDLRDKNSQLKQDILDQKNILEELFKAEEGAATLAGRLCSTDANGNINDARTQCTGSEPNIYTGEATCCITIDAVECSTLFPSEVQVSARNQCNVLVSTVKNHDEQLKAIREVDEKQTALIDGLLSDVENLNDQVRILEEGYALLADTVSNMATKLSDIDQRLLIVEFKAARSEAAAAIMERADLNLAWIARRTTDISSRFCSAGVNQSLNQFDYEAARQNWHYCKERLEFLTRAKELTQLAKAYTNGLLSVNVDSTCNATINGKSAESLSTAEILDSDVFSQIQSKCTTGGPIVAKAMMYNIVQLLNMVGPDFRTAQYMTKKAKIAQLLFFGKPVNETSASERAAFENVDPTHAQLRDTLYARVERPFKKRYVESRMRTVAGTFPERPSDIPEVIPGFNTVWKHQEINSGSSSFFQRLAALELEGQCSDCGFAVERRTTTDVVISRDGKERFSYPKDAESLCPVHNDVIVMKHQDGKYYPYYLNYSHMREDFKPVLRSGSHRAIANSDADMNSGNFAYCGRHGDYLVNRNGLGVAQLKSRLMLTLTQPYGRTYAGRGQCVHTALVCVMRDEEWKAPSGSTDLVSYLNGYSNSVVQNKCNYNVGSKSQVRTRMLENYEAHRIRTFSGVVDQASVNLRSLASSSTTQLSQDYWTLRDNTMYYGVDNQPVSQSLPFLASAQSHTDPFIRAHHALTQPVEVQECTPNEVEE